MGALSHIKVLDLSRVLAGPYCTQMLGDLGAEIFKIEKPYAGDDTRFWGPPFLQHKDGQNSQESAYYLSINRNKKSVAIDIAKKQGQDILLKMLEDCDVLIENFKVDSLKKFGLDYLSLKDRFPKLIYCSITGFGQNGPLSHEPGYDLVAQAMGGFMAATGEPNGAPMKAGVAISDIVTGLHAAIGILAALNKRSITNQGEYIDISLLDSTLATMTNLSQYYLTSHKVAQRFGNAHSTIVPYQAFALRDGYVVIAVGNDHQFAKLCAVLNRPDLAETEKFKTNSNRLLHRAELIPLLEKILLDFDRENFIDLCREADIPAAPVQNLEDAFASDQVQARDMVVTLMHKTTEQNISLVGSPLKLYENPVRYELAPPILGQDTFSVLKSFGFNDVQCNELEAQKIIQQAVIKG
jgi:crotonobetainyl-CoA:carnitine CoA-transferase CaiB-like acyl-CoA transferase